MECGVVVSLSFVGWMRLSSGTARMSAVSAGGRCCRRRVTGHWQVDEAPGGSGRTPYVSFDLGIPLLAEMRHPAATTSLADNTRQTLHAVEAAATGAVRARR